MDSIRLIARMATAPNPLELWSRTTSRIKNSPMQPIDDPSVVLTRRYGIGARIGASQMPQDYTMMHWGGTYRGRKIGTWADSLLVGQGDSPFNAPPMVTLRNSANTPQFGTQWNPPAWDSEEV